MVKVLVDPVWNEAGMNPLVKSTDGAAAYDIRVAEAGILYPGQTVKLRTGMKLRMSPYMYFMICSRSGLGSKGIVDTKGIGIVDSDYMDEVFLTMYALPSNASPFVYAVGDRLAQGIFQHKVPTTLTFDSNDFYKDAQAGNRSGGFGSTGIK